MDLETALGWATAALGALGWIVLVRFGRFKPGPPARPAPTVSVIVPARNEEHNLPTLLGSLSRQSVRPLETLVLDDNSTDRTASLAQQLGATVLTAPPLPAGWRGKPWACHQGAQVAKGELLLFVDADTWLEPDGLGRILAGYPGGAFSVGPYHAVRQWYEELSLFFNIVMAAGTVPDGLFGQLLLVDRASYRRVGGHESVKDKILEHYRLAAALRAAGLPVGSVTGQGLCSVRMYPKGLGELVAGWTKGFASGAEQTPRFKRLLVIAWMVGLASAPLGVWGGSDTLGWGALYLLGALQVGWLSRRVGAFRWPSALLYPVPLCFFFAVFLRSALRSGKSVTWKGREIRAD
ncbi:MAG: glycosyltransferase [Verrucomicrobia bacterium]|nr:glycosyltransferase [Verrucomicrobiota bacterium]